jgi:hypothetical protein
MVENIESKQPKRKQRGKGRPWTKGQSGNPRGKPVGARHKATMAAEALLDGESEKLTRKAIEKAMDGDSVALRLCLERIIPARKDRPVRIELPPMTSAASAGVALATVTAAVANGELTPGEGAEVGRIVTGFLKATEIVEIEARLAKIEARIGGGK